MVVKFIKNQMFYEFHWDQVSMDLATAFNIFGGQLQNLHSIIVLLSLGTKLSKATRFDSNNLKDFGKMWVSLEEMFVKKTIFNTFLPITFNMQRNQIR